MIKRDSMGPTLKASAMYPHVVKKIECLDLCHAGT
ncbi:hypothetical protein PS645_01483 [Pseudomonas fluorescens]|uniref:Uncharacterized protein n=1 Tax=Pseudomonas fluorescens TaxID=294 RepID=A0A5E6RB70_PSEFL|nr:hypothetical protein PS645_01483 [Pseudomonas fluorescens]